MEEPNTKEKKGKKKYLLFIILILLVFPVTFVTVKAYEFFSQNQTKNSKTKKLTGKSIEKKSHKVKDNNAVVKIEEKDDSEEKQAINIVVKGYNGIFDGEYHKMATADNVPDGVKITYSLDKKRYFDSCPMQKDSGFYNVYFKVDGGEKYESTSGEITGVITKTDQKVSVSDYKTVYSGDSQKIGTVTGIKEDAKVLYSINGSQMSESIPKVFDAGIYNIKFYIDETKNYKAYTGEYTFEVENKMIEVPSGINVVYDSKEHVGVKSSEGYTLSGDLKDSEAGTHKVVAKLDKNYIWKDKSYSDKTVNWVIDRDNAIPDISTVKDLTYGDKLKLMSVKDIPSGSVVVYSLDGSTYKKDIPTSYVSDIAIDAGVHNLSWKVDGGNNHNDSEGSAKVIVDKAQGVLFADELDRSITWPEITFRSTSINYSGDGNLTVESSDDSVLSVQKDTAASKKSELSEVNESGNINYSIKKDGHAAITVRSEGSKNYTEVQKTFETNVIRASYNLTVDPNGGTSEDPGAVIPYEGTRNITDPERTGYTFAGWNISNNASSIRDGIYTQGKGNTTIKALWNAIKYPITYNLNGGINDESNPSEYTVEDTVKLAIPTKTGYDFAGWSEGDSIKAGTIGEKTFTATWKPSIYSIVYDVADGTNDADNPETYNIESEDITLKAPTRNGYTFAGWSEGDSIKKGSTGNKTFTAIWKSISYPITYNLNGGINNKDNPDSYTIEDNISLKVPTKENYTFVKWNEGNEIGKGNTGSKTFTAVWTPLKYDITYDVADGENNADNPIDYNIESEDITLKAPTRNGYTFAGWNEGDSIKKGSTGNKKFTAKWEPITYKIIYAMADGTNNKDNPSTYNIESEDIDLKTPEKTGYKFTGWTEGNVIKKGSIGDKTFTATWEKIEYPLTYELNGGVNNKENPTSYTVEDNVNFKNPTKYGYDFVGWREADNIVKGTVGAKTFTATWKTHEYSINYILNGGINNNDNPSLYTIESKTISLLNPSRTGYTFDGWIEGGSIEKGSTGDKTFTAKWKAIYYTANYTVNIGKDDSGNPYKFTVEDEILLKNPTALTGYTFTWDHGAKINRGTTNDVSFIGNYKYIIYPINYKLNGGINDGSNPSSYNVDSNIVLNNPTRTGYTFTGWTEGNTIKKGSIGDKTFTANWQANSYNVTFDGNGGNGGGTLKETYDSGMSVPADTVRGSDGSYHYSFSGWFTDPVGGQRVTSGTMYQTASDRTYYAHWNASGHAYGGWYGNTANCTSGGVEYRTCSVCGHVESRGTSALGHAWNAWYVSREPRVNNHNGLLSQDGQLTHVCSRCGSIETKDMGSSIWSKWQNSDGDIVITNGSGEFSNFHLLGYCYTGSYACPELGGGSYQPRYCNYSTGRHAYVTPPDGNYTFESNVYYW